MLFHGWVADPQQSVDILDYQYVGDLTVREALAAIPDTTEITNALMAKVVDGKTFEQCLKLVTAVLAGKCSVVGSTVTFRDMADSANRVTATTDDDGQRTAVTLNA